MPRKLSQTPAAIAARERRLTRAIDRHEREFRDDVLRKMRDGGLSFDEAWIAAGGSIIPLKVRA